MQNLVQETFVSVIADKDTINGFRIAGISNNNNDLLFTVSLETKNEEIFSFLYQKLNDKKVGIIFICDFVVEKINLELSKFNSTIPFVMVIPSSKINLYNYFFNLFFIHI